MKNKIGKAYAFFDCSASRDQIDAELPTIRECVKTPRELELSLMRCTSPNNSIVKDSKLWALTRSAREVGMKYLLEANYPNQSNEQTANELVTVLNQMYQSQLYKEGEKFRGEIVYKQRGEYIFRE